MEKERFTQVLLDMTDTLFRVAAIQLRQPADREDAVQECLRRAWEKRQQLQDERYAQTWVICILLNECYRMQRRMSRTVPVESVAAVQQQEGSELKETLMQLDEKYRTPILLHYIEGYSVAETAKILRMPQGTVKTRLSRGRTALKAILNEEVFGK